MQAKDLKPGDRFKWDRAQRNWREVSNVVLLEAGKFRGPEEYTGKLVITMKYSCREVLLGPDDPVVLNTSPNF